MTTKFTHARLDGSGMTLQINAYLEFLGMDGRAMKIEQIDDTNVRLTFSFRHRRNGPYSDDYTSPGGAETYTVEDFTTPGQGFNVPGTLLEVQPDGTPVT